MPSRRGQKGKAAAYSLKEVRRRERELGEQGERAYRQLVADWQAKTPSKAKPGVAATNGTRVSRPSAGQAARQASVPEPALRSGVDHAHSGAANDVARRRRFRTPETGRSRPAILKSRPQEAVCGPPTSHRGRSLARKQPQSDAR